MAGVMWDATINLGLLQEVYQAIIAGLRLTTVVAAIAQLEGVSVRPFS
jgi:hypothetical protein